MDTELGAPATAVERWFFTPLYYPLSPWSVVGWWERRRLVYNVGVGAAGLVTLGMGGLLGQLPSSPNPFAAPLLGVLVYAIAANACYTIGPVTDLILRRVLGLRAPDIAPAMFRYGFVFSVGLTLLPIPLMVFGTLMRFLFGAGTAS